MFWIYFSVYYIQFNLAVWVFILDSLPPLVLPSISKRIIKYAERLIKCRESYLHTNYWNANGRVLDCCYYIQLWYYSNSTVTLFKCIFFFFWVIELFCSISQKSIIDNISHRVNKFVRLIIYNNESYNIMMIMPYDFYSGHLLLAVVPKIIWLAKDLWHLGLPVLIIIPVMNISLIEVQNIYFWHNYGLLWSFIMNFDIDIN